MGYDIVDLWFKEIDYTNRISRQVYLEVDSSRTPVSESLEDIMSVLTGVCTVKKKRRENKKWKKEESEPEEQKTILNLPR